MEKSWAQSGVVGKVIPVLWKSNTADKGLFAHSSDFIGLEGDSQSCHTFSKPERWNWVLSWRQSQLEEQIGS